MATVTSIVPLTKSAQPSALKSIRKPFGVTQKVFAEYMGVALRTYEDLESGRRATRPFHVMAAKGAALRLAIDLSRLDALPGDVQTVAIRLANEVATRAWRASALK